MQEIKKSIERNQKTLFKNFMATSYPRKVHPAVGNVRIITGTHPRYNARRLSFATSSLKTLRIPWGYFPSGVACRRDFSTSMGRATAQLHMPDRPPATRTWRLDRARPEFHAPIQSRITALERKKAPEAGISRRKVAEAPRKTLAMPP